MAETAVPAAKKPSAKARKAAAHPPFKNLVVEAVLALKEVRHGPSEQQHAASCTRGGAARLPIEPLDC